MTYLGDFMIQFFVNGNHENHIFFIGDQLYQLQKCNFEKQFGTITIPRILCTLFKTKCHELIEFRVENYNLET